MKSAQADSAAANPEPFVPAAVLKASEDRFRALFIHAVSAIAVLEIVWDAGGHAADFVFLDANPAFETHTGLRVSDVLGKRATDVYPGIAKTGLIETCGKVVLTGKSAAFETYFEFTGKHYHIHAYKIGEQRFAIDFNDVTARIEAETVLRRRLDYEHLLYQVAVIAARDTPTDRVLDQCLAAMGAILDVSRIYIFVHHRDSDTMDNTVEWCAPGVTPQIANLQGLPASRFDWWVDRLRRNDVIKVAALDDIPDGYNREFLRRQGVQALLVIPISADGDFYGFLGFDDCRRPRAWPEEDVTLLRTVGSILGSVIDRNQTRLRLEQSSRLASLGTLVAGVAHEINNPIGVVMMNTPMIREAWDDVQPILEAYRRDHGDFPVAGLDYSESRDNINLLFEGITDSAERIRRIVADLKAYARHDPPGPPVDMQLNAVVESAVRLLDSMIRKATRHFTITLSDRMPPLRGHAHRLEQVVVNLIVNACQALTEKQQALAVRTAFDAGRGVVTLTVRDEGRGMPSEVADRVLEPFFTTRRGQGGSGLGLSVANAIINDHGGWIDVASQAGRGTAVTVTLPVAGIANSDASS